MIVCDCNWRVSFELSARYAHRDEDKKVDIGTLPKSWLDPLTARQVEQLLPFPAHSIGEMYDAYDDRPLTHVIIKKGGIITIIV